MLTPNISSSSSSRVPPPLAQELTPHEVKNLTDEILLRRSQGEEKSSQQIKEEFLESKKLGLPLSVLEDLYDQFIIYIESDCRVGDFEFHPSYSEKREERITKDYLRASKSYDQQTTPLVSEHTFSWLKASRVPEVDEKTPPSSSSPSSPSCTIPATSLQSSPSSRAPSPLSEGEKEPSSNTLGSKRVERTSAHAGVDEKRGMPTSVLQQSTNQSTELVPTFDRAESHALTCYAGVSSTLQREGDRLINLSFQRLEESKTVSPDDIEAHLLLIDKVCDRGMQQARQFMEQAATSYKDRTSSLVDRAEKKAQADHRVDVMKKEQELRFKQEAWEAENKQKVEQLEHEQKVYEFEQRKKADERNEKKAVEEARRKAAIEEKKAKEIEEQTKKDNELKDTHEENKKTYDKLVNDYNRARAAKDANSYEWKITEDILPKIVGDKAYLGSFKYTKKEKGVFSWLFS